MNKKMLIVIIIVLLIIIGVMSGVIIGMNAKDKLPSGNNNGGTSTTTNNIFSPIILEPSNGLKYRLNDDGVSYSVTGIGTCLDTDIVIPETYEGLPVTDIGDFAFSECETITSVFLNNYTKSIGAFAFYNCFSLIKINMPDSLTTIKEGAFCHCYSLLSVTIGKSVETMGRDPFEGCMSLIEIKVDNNNQYYKSIDGNLYTKDGKTLLKYAPGTSATSFTIPNHVQVIDCGTFGYSKYLTNVTISNSVNFIGNHSFSNCTNLTNVIIPNTVKNIDDWAFAWCESLTSIIFEGTVEQWDNIEKGVSWNLNVPATKIVCSNGTVILEKST